MSKEQIISIDFNTEPDVRIRVINQTDAKQTIEGKKRFPFELHNSIDVTVTTDRRTFTFNIYNGFKWNGADIPRAFWRIVGSRTDNDFLIASMLHDYLLNFKVFILNEILKNEIPIDEYRRLTSLIFRHVIKEQGTNTVKANVMAWCVDVFQICNKRSWKCQ